jgi:putative protease
MELLSPAGSLQKLQYAYLFGADAAYIGVQGFSLRDRASNVKVDSIEDLIQVKGDKKLYGAVNRFFHESDYQDFAASVNDFKNYPFDAYIVSDLGPAMLLKKTLGDNIRLHLSTQANTLNSGAIQAYKELGFSRIILGREVTLDDIKRIKDAVPEIEIETFVHGAMCMAYSGRCFLSAHLSDRSANEGDCAHTCRWKYNLLEKKEPKEYYIEEETRKGEYFPVIEEDGYSTILSSKDLNMIDHLSELKEAGVDSLKIEGRMKSLYYVATVTRAYRKAIDVIEHGGDAKDALLYKEELDSVSHREYSTGFFFNKKDIETPTDITYLREYLLIGTVEKQVGPNRFELDLKNKLTVGDEIEYIGPEVLFLKDSVCKLFDENNEAMEVANHHQKVYLETKAEIKEGYIMRKRLN